jgi:hypothetical protein
VPRVIGTIDATGAYVLAISSKILYSEANLRSGATDGSGNFWGSGSTNGICYFGNTAPAATIENSIPNCRVVNVVNGSLLFSTQFDTNDVDADDGAVSPHQRRTAADALLAFPPGRFLRDVLRGRQNRRAIAQCRPDQTRRDPDVRHPVHAANGYIARLLKAGRKVAICEQLEEARPGQLVKREVTQILSPGTHFDERLLAAERNNFLAALCPCGKTFGLALADLTTGDFKTTELEGEAALRAELERLRPAEIIYPAAAEKLAARPRPGLGVESVRGLGVRAGDGAVHGARTFQGGLAGRLRVEGPPAAMGAAGAVLHYLTQHLRRDAPR